MSLTNPTIHVPDTRVSIPSWVRHHLGWVLVALAVVATSALLAVTLVDGDTDTRVDPVTSTFDADRGSVSAIDHRTVVAGGGPAVGQAPAAPRAGSLQHESISAIDARTAPAR